MYPELVPAGDALPLVVKLSGKSMYAVSVEMGRVPSYLATTIGRKSIPTLATAAEIAEHCEYRLVLVPNREDIPLNSIVISPE